MSDLIRQDLSPRVYFDEPVEIFTSGGASAEPLWGRALNLSDGGIYICCDDLLPEETPVQLRFTLPGGEVIEAHAAVIRTVPPQSQVEPRGMALRFLSLAPDSAESLERFILARLQPETGEPVRLQLGELGFPIVARAGSAWGNILSVDAELPFLRVGSEVRFQLPQGSAAAGEGSIRWVSIHVPPETGIPRLNIGIEAGAPLLDEELHRPSEEEAQAPDGVLDETMDPICNHVFADHSRDLDQTLRAERRALAS